MSKTLAALALALTLTLPVMAQEPITLFQKFTALSRSIDNGRAPSPEQILAAADEPQPDASDLQLALPLILKALASNDKDVRAYTLTTLSGLQYAPPAETLGAAATKTAAPPPPTQPSYKSAIARLLTPIIPQITAHLPDDTETNQILITQVLSGFGPHPPTAAYPPLLTYLQRDDAVGPVGQAVVESLLTLGPIPDDVSTAISRFLRRSDQTSATRADLIEAVATRPYQSVAINRALIGYLDSDDPSVRARLILSLPQLDLPLDLFADTKAHVANLAANDQDNLQVVTAAKSVIACWNTPRTPIPCPAYQVP